MSSLVVHCKKSPYDVYIGRPSKWGNPFEIGLHLFIGQAVNHTNYYKT